MLAERVAIAEATKGWLTPEEGPALREWAISTGGPLVEIGSYCGKSTVWLADAAEELGSVLVSIDHHRGNPEMRAGNDCHDPEVIDADGRHDTLPFLRRTLASAGLEDSVVIVAAPSQRLAPLWGAEIGFLFIDGGHDPESAQRDADLWTPFIRPGGLVVFHDVTIPHLWAVTETLTNFEPIEVIGCARVLRKC